MVDEKLKQLEDTLIKASVRIDELKERITALETYKKQLRAFDSLEVIMDVLRDIQRLAEHSADFGTFSEMMKVIKDKLSPKNELVKAI